MFCIINSPMKCNSELKSTLVTSSDIEIYDIQNIMM